MSIIKKNVWKEGLFLQPQHFQQMEQSIYDRLHFLYNTKSTDCYGFTKLSVRYENTTDTVEVLTAEGVMPEGTPFSLSTPANLPTTRICTDHFTGDKKKLVIYLALPKLTIGTKNITTEDDYNLSSRFISHSEEIVDEYGGVEKKDIEFGKLNFQILFDNEKRDGFEFLPILRLIKNGENGLVADPSFISPLLRVSASEKLMQKLNSFLELLLLKVRTLSKNRVIDNDGYAGYDSGREGSIMLLYTLNSSLPIITALIKDERSTPTELFRELISLTGRLCTFSSDISIEKIPLYLHDDIYTSFDKVTKQIKGILTAGVRETCAILPVQEAGLAKYSVKVENRKLFINSDFYIGIYADVPENEIVVSTLSMIKMSSYEDLENIIISSLPGIPLYHTFSVPSKIPKKPGFVYFRIDTDSNKWESVMRTSRISIYLPGNLKDLKLEFFALRKDGQKEGAIS